jgi:hypothetical protein
VKFLISPYRGNFSALAGCLYYSLPIGTGPAAIDSFKSWYACDTAGVITIPVPWNVACNSELICSPV